MRSILTIAAFLCFTAAFAQSKGKVTGKVAASADASLDGIIISLLKTGKLSLVKATFTESNGQFEFTDLPLDSFQLMINHLGYKKYISESIALNSNSPEIELPLITLQPEGEKLAEVTVTAKVPFVERKIDRTIINPEALISNAGSNALDVLAKSPGIMVDENGNVKLKGKSGVMILIDDKPTYLTSDELASYLKSLPADAIKHIEIMTNPPAQYDAAGNAGIINIRTKKNKLKGLNGNVSANYSQGRYFRTSDNININYSSKKITLFSTLSYGNYNSYHDLYIDRQYKNEDLSTKSVFSQNTYIQPSTQAYNAKLGFDYYITDKTTLGLVTKGAFVNSFTSSYNYATFTYPDNSLNTTVIADNNDANEFKNGSANLNLRHQFDSTGKTLTVDMDYVAYSTHIIQKYRNDVSLADGTNIYHDTQSGSLPSNINIYAFKTDYTHPFKNNSRFDAGLKSSYTQTDNDAVYLITLNNITENNYNLSNHFMYDEMINAAYANYAASYKRIELQAGLRFESTLLNGKQLGNPVKPASSFDRNYNNLFPTFYFSWHMDSASFHTLSFSYGKRVNRPFYKDLNPFISPLDKYTFYEGNPYLKPTFAHNLSLVYGFKSLFSISASYNNTTDQIQETIEIKDGIYYSRPGNIGSSEQISLSAESSIPVAKWLTTTLYTEAMYSQFKSKLYTETLNSSGTYWYINVNNSFQFKKGWSAEISGQYITNFIDSQFAFGDYGDINVGLQKRILKEQGSIKLSCNDILHTSRIRGRINNLQLTDANWYGPRDTRVVSLTFSYRFGKNTNSKPKHTGSGSEAEQNRVK